jgi:hypothetical protein
MPVRENIQPGDSLRGPSHVAEPDPRSDAVAGDAYPSLLRQHGQIAQFVMSPFVPAPVAIQFETAKNLYLYAWHVYRFYPVAESLALTTLEFGLRERLASTVPATANKQARRQPTLEPLLRRAVDLGLIRNEGFQRWHVAGKMRAIERYQQERLEAMIAQELDSVEIDDADATVTPEDLSWDLVKVLLATLHKHRNMHAHGGSHLMPNVLGTFELVAEILNQIFTE